MSHHNTDTAHSHTDDQPVDVVESIVPSIPVVLPLVGGVLMFLLAFIAVKVA